MRAIALVVLGAVIYWIWLSQSKKIIAGPFWAPEASGHRKQGR